MKKIFLYGCLLLTIVSCGNSGNEPENKSSQTQNSGIAKAMSSLQAPMAFISTFVNVQDAMLQVSSSQSNQLKLPRSSTKVSKNAGLLGDATTTGYPIIDWSPKDGTWPIDVIVDYGTQNVVGADGLAHRGKINIHATGMFEETGTNLVANFDDFYVYNAILTGKQTIVNGGNNNDGHLQFRVRVDSGKVASIGHFDYSENTTRVLIAGYKEDGSLNSDIKTHTYSITGEMNYLSSDDTIPDFTITIDDVPMVIAVGDAYPTKGELEIVANNNKSFTFPKNIIPTEILNFIPNLNLPDKIELNHFDVYFLGKNSDGTYKVEVELDIPMITQSVSLMLSFNIDKDGKISSIRLSQDK